MFNKKKVKALEKEVEMLNLLIKSRDKFIEEKLKEIKELKGMVTDLECNVEFLVNNLTKRKRELIRPSK